MRISDLLYLRHFEFESGGQAYTVKLEFRAAARIIESDRHRETA